MSTSLPIKYDKRLMLVSGRANPDLSAKIADKLDIPSLNKVHVKLDHRHHDKES